MSLDDILIKGDNVGNLFSKYKALQTEKGQKILLGEKADQNKVKEVTDALKETLRSRAPGDNERFYQNLIQPENEQVEQEAMTAYVLQEKAIVEQGLQNPSEKLCLDKFEAIGKAYGWTEAEDATKKKYNYNNLPGKIKELVDKNFAELSFAEQKQGATAVMSDYLRAITRDKDGVLGIDKMLGAEASKKEKIEYIEGLGKEIKSYIDTYLADWPEDLRNFVFNRLKAGSQSMAEVLASVENEIMSGAYATMSRGKKKSLGYEQLKNTAKKLGYLRENTEDNTQAAGAEQAAATA